MVSITFSIPEEVRKIMKEFPEVNWTHLVRSSIEEKAKKLAIKRELLKKLDKEKDFIDWSVNTIREGRRKK
ncbi:MAG: hypothetical protein AABY15_01115 [Nanoarchaeota archaeon]